MTGSLAATPAGGDSGIPSHELTELKLPSVMLVRSEESLFNPSVLIQDQVHPSHLQVSMLCSTRFTYRAGSVNGNVFFGV